MRRVVDCAAAVVAVLCASAWFHPPIVGEDTWWHLATGREIAARGWPPLVDEFSFTAYLDLLNVYNQQNAEGFITDYRSREQEPIPSLPILPVIGLSGEF